MRPTFVDESLNLFLCRLSELIWSMLKYLQTYSIIMLSAYRLIACYSTQLFRKINKSYFLIMIPIFMIWILSFLIYVVTKYGFKTTFGSVYCFDGYSDSFNNELKYFIVSLIFSILIPFSTALVLFILIYKKMTENDETIHNRSQINQLLFLNVSYGLNFIVLSCLEMRHVIDFSVGTFIQILRIIDFLIYSFIPLISLYYSPFFAKRFYETNIQEIQIAYFRNTVTFHFISK